MDLKQPRTIKRISACWFNRLTMWSCLSLILNAGGSRRLHTCEVSNVVSTFVGLFCCCLIVWSHIFCRHLRGFNFSCAVLDVEIFVKFSFSQFFAFVIDLNYNSDIPRFQQCLWYKRCQKSKLYEILFCTKTVFR